MNEDIELQDPIKWVIKAKNELDKADIHLTNKELVKLLQTYIQEAFETYRTKLNNNNQEEKHTTVFGLSTTIENEDDE